MVQTVPQIIVGNRRELLQELNRLGYNPSDLFLKYSISKQNFIRWNSWPDALNSTQSYLIPDTLERELTRLLRIQEIIPDNTPRIIIPVRDHDLSFVGHLTEYIRNSKRFRIRHYLPLIGLLATLKRNGVPHGDPNPGNILVRLDDSLVLLDPAPSAPSPGYSNDDINQVVRRAPPQIRHALLPHP